MLQLEAIATEMAELSIFGLSIFAPSPQVFRLSTPVANAILSGIPAKVPSTQGTRTRSKTKAGALAPGRTRENKMRVLNRRHNENSYHVYLNGVVIFALLKAWEDFL